jgi:hypothetical protein
MCLSIAVKFPHRVLATGTHKGFQWTVVHNDSQIRCGYVRIPKGHPWHGKDYNDLNCDVHGGLTFAEADMPCDEPGDDDAWWVGFDCAHGFDAPDPELPRGDGFPMELLSLLRSGCAVVRSQEYVESNCRGLCDQAAAAV